MRARTFFVLGLVVVLTACGGPGPADGASDGGREDAGDPSALCRRDGDCSNGLWCDGEERCAPDDPRADARGCVAEAPRCESAECDEENDRCLGACVDEDGDGALSVACGGSDCDDRDPRRYPGAREVCDVDHVDEDCDPSTYGYRDLDGDGYVSSACCNGTNCGTDCDDMREGSHPGLPEVCDGFDNDCDGLVDEGVLRQAYVDADGDGYGDPTKPVMVDCSVTEGVADNGLDCDDGDPDVRPGAAERCNGRDDNCDGIYEIDADGDGHLSPRAVCVDDMLPRDDCNDFDATVYPGALELCDLRDNDCDGASDERPAADASCRSAEVVGAYCAIGACTITACAPGRADCDGLANNGCETSTDDDPLHCGGCGVRCGFGAACVQGSCEPVRVVDLDASDVHTCFVTDTGGVGCFGGNDNGRLGDGTQVARDYAVEVLGIGDAVEVAASGRGTCALLSDGSTACWGNGATRPAPVADVPTSSLLVGADGFGWSCTVADDATAWCWGENSFTDLLQTEPPHAIGLEGVTELATSMRHTCALDASGSARCFGMADTGQLGDGLAAHSEMCTFATSVGSWIISVIIDECSTTPVDVVDIGGLRQITTGIQHTCARDDRRVWCWGLRHHEGGTQTQTSPVQVQDVGPEHTLVALDAGARHTCAVRSDGRTFCWGDNADGQLGNGSAGGARGTPGEVPGVSLVEVAAASRHTCGIDVDGAVRCWGDNTGGLLGDRTTVRRLAPTRVAGIDFATEVTGSSTDACARTQSGRVICWGARRTTSELVPGLEQVVELVGRGTRFCARTRAGEVKCWSAGGTPTTVSLPPARSIAVGSQHACAVVEDGTVRCWGANGNGQLGDGTTENASEPVAVVGVTDAVELALGSAHSCARLGDGRVVCWGSNQKGELGDGTGTPASGPVEVSGVRDALEIVAGNGHTCVRHATGGVSCWGDDADGQLGDGPTQTLAVSPRRVLGLSGVRSLAAGIGHTCALLWSGEIWCWGSNSMGQTGLPYTGLEDGARVHVPRHVTDVTAERIGAGDEVSCAVDIDRRVLCWGDDREGQLGDGGWDACMGLCSTFTCRWDCDRETPQVVPGI